MHVRVSVCMVACKFVCMYVRMLICIHVCLYVCIFVCAYACIHTHIHTWICARTHAHSSRGQRAPHTHIHIHQSTVIYKHKHLNIQTHILLYTHLHTHILIYTRTHIPTHTHAAAAALQHSDDAARRATVCCSSMSYMDTWYKWCGSTLSSTDSRCKLRFDHVKTVAPKISGTSTSAPPSISIRATCEPSVCGEGGGWRGEGAFECVRVFKERRRVKRTHGV